MIRVRVLRDGQEVALEDLEIGDYLIRLTESVEDYQEVLAGTLEANAPCPS